MPWPTCRPFAVLKPLFARFSATKIRLNLIEIKADKPCKICAYFGGFYPPFLVENVAHKLL